MSSKQPVVSGKDLVALLEKKGFEVTRVNGSHHRLRHKDGRVTTVPVHKNQDLPKGLLRKIVREDLQMEMKEFESWIKE
jgi:predicted RNA binding protein YcfA (HicA-like mRNA interferase family)